LVFPSLAKLQKKGFAATMALKKQGDLVCLVLDKPGIEEHWALTIDLKDAEAEIYLSAFEAILPPTGTKARRLADALGLGASIETIKQQYVAGPPAKLIKTYILKHPNGKVEELGDDAPDFLDFVEGRSFLATPQRYEEFRQQHLT
jgi:hypothetical protein